MVTIAVTSNTTKTKTTLPWHCQKLIPHLSLHPITNHFLRTIFLLSQFYFFIKLKRAKTL